MKSLEQVRSNFATILASLELPIEAVFEQFKPDDYILDQLNEFIPTWKDMTLHELNNTMAQLTEDVSDDIPDIVNGRMSPFNIFDTLSRVYGW